ncbi:MAG: insulinase family protein [Bacteroidota bacterium]
MKNKVLILFLILFVSAASFAQLDRSKKPAPGPAPEIKLGDYESFTLKNGLKVFVVTNKKIPKVAFSLIIDRDPILEGKNAGYISTAGQLLRTGTKTRTKDKLDEEIDFIGASISTSSTSIYAQSLKKHVNKLLELMSDIVLNSNFTQEEFDKIIKQTLSGLAAEKDDPNAISGNVRNILYYGKDHPYGEPMTEETVKSITLDMCKEYYNTYFKPNATYLAVVGDITKSEAQKLVEKYFGKWESKDVPTKTYETPKAPVINKVSLVDRSNSVQSVISLGYPIELKVGSEDAIKVSVLNTILGGSFASRLNQNLREKNGFTYGAGSSFSSDKYIGSFSSSTTVRNSATDSAITEMLNEIKKIRTEKVSEDELQLTKNYMTGNFARSLENPQTIANFAVNIERYNLPKDYYKNYLKTLNSITSDELLATAKKYIKPNNMQILVVGNGEEVAKNLNRFSVSNKVDYYDLYGNPVDPSAKKLPAGLTAEQVLNKYIEVVGGKENMLKVKDKTTKLSGTVQGMNLTLTISQKEPNKLYQFIDAGVFQQKVLFDGVKGRTESMGQVQDMPAEQLEEMKMQGSIHTILKYDELGIKTELTGMESINGKDAYKIALTSPSGKKSTYYYSADSGLLVRTVSSVTTPQGTFNQTTDMDDYRDVQGVMYPFKLSQSFGPQTIELTVSSVEINTGLSDSLFEIK